VPPRRLDARRAASRVDSQPRRVRRRRPSERLAHGRPLVPAGGRARHARTAEIAPPRWSADGRYLAAQAYIAWPKRAKTVGTIALARADGKSSVCSARPTRSPCSPGRPRGHRLAYTTSGFPAPHELFLLEGLRAQPRRILSATRRFDWITWSPDSRWLLFDDARRSLAPPPCSQRRGQRALPRLGGRPLWCCPQNPSRRTRNHPAVDRERERPGALVAGWVELCGRRGVRRGFKAGYPNPRLRSRWNPSPPRSRIA